MFLGKALFILTVLLFLLWFNVTFFVWVPVIWLAKTLENDGSTFIGGLLRMGVIAYAIAVLWLSFRMSYYMVVEKMLFLDGVKAGFRDARLYLSLLPLIGHWFIKKSDKPEADDDENDAA